MLALIKTLIELIVAPQKALQKVIKTKKMSEMLVILAINWILISAAIATFSSDYRTFFTILVAGIVGTLSLAFLLHLGLILISGKGDYRSVLSSLTYPFFGVSLSTFIISIVSWFDPALLFLGMVLLAIYFTVALFGTFRILKESFKLDLVSVWIVIGLLLLAILLSIYGTGVLYYLRSGFRL